MQKEASTRQKSYFSPFGEQSVSYTSIGGPYPDMAIQRYINLRKEELRDTPLRIGIDGVSGSGKGNLASELSRILGIPSFDSGKYYRAITAVTTDEYFQTIKNDDAALQSYVDSLRIEITKDAQLTQHVLVTKNAGTGEEECIDVTNIVGTEAISKRVSSIAETPRIRERVKIEQNTFMESNSSFIIEGRNMYKVAADKANVMIYLHADRDIIIQREMERQKSSPEAAKQSAIDRTKQDEHRTGEGKLFSRVDAYASDSPYDFCIDTSYIQKEHTPLVALNEIVTLFRARNHEQEKQIQHLPVLATT